MFKRTISLIAAVFAAAISFAQPLPNDPEVLGGKLENGMTYYIRHNELPKGRAEFYLVSDVGAIQEAEGQDGLAHFLEHMCFNGLKNLPGKMMLDYLQSIGAEFGRNINAGTGVEYTSYMLNNIPVSREGIVDTCLLVLHDWSHFVTCDSLEVENERGVILEEKRTRNTAAWRMFEQSLPYYFGDSKYASCNLIGSEQTLKTFRPETLADYYHKWYRPDLQAVIVVGDVDKENIKAKLEKLFADIPAPVNPEPKVMPAVTVKDTTVIGIITDKENSSTSIEFIWEVGEPKPKSTRSTVQYYCKDIIDYIVGLAMAERLNEIALKPGAPFTSAKFGIGEICQTCEAFQGVVICKNGKALTAGKAFITELERMRRYGFCEDEVERAKTNIIKYAKDAVAAKDTRENDSFVQEYINNFIDGDAYMTPEDEYEFVKAICENITPGIVNNFICSKFGKGRLVVLYKAPDKEGLTHPSADELAAIVEDVKKAEIASGFAAAVSSDLMVGIDIKPGRIVRTEEGRYGATVWTLSNSLRVVALPTDYKKNEVKIDFRRNGGKNIVPTEELASFDASIIRQYQSNRGIGPYSKTTLKKMLVGKSASCAPYVTNMKNGISGGCASSDIETLFQLFCLQFMSPRYDKDEWDTGINQIKSVLPNMVTTPDYAFQKHLFSDIYGDNPRIGVLSEETLDKADFSTFRKYSEKMFGGVAGGTLYIIGDFKLEEIEPLVAEYCGCIMKGGKPAKINKDRLIRLEERPLTDEFIQTMTTPKVSVAQIWNVSTEYNVQKAVLGKAAEFILDDIYVKVLREQEGGTYGAQCSFELAYEPYAHAMLQVVFDTNTEQQEKLRSLARQCLIDLAANGPTEAQLTQAIENARKNLPENRIKNAWWKSCLVIGDRLGIDYDAEYEKAIDGINAEGIKLILSEIVSAGNLVETVMLPAE